MTETKLLDDNRTVKAVKEILQQFNLSPKSFCLAPYTHLDYDQSGEMHSCYEGKDKMGNWRTGSVFEQFNNKEYQNLRQAHRIGDTISTEKNCKSCYHHEDHNVLSLRLNNLVNEYNNLGHERFAQLIERLSNIEVDAVNPANLDHVEIRLSNFCNLRCLHCDHRSSTQWLNFFTDQERLDAAKNVGVPIHPDANAQNIMKFFSDHQHSTAKHFDEIVHTLQNSKLITFSGGEPLLDPYYKPLMDELIKHEYVSSKQLDIHTNLNIKNIENYFDHWNKFEKTSLYVSIDCPPSTYKYFRRNGDWQLVYDNIMKIKKEFYQNQKVIIIGHITFGLFGALRYKEIADTWAQMQLQPNSNLITEGPTSARYLTDSLKEKVIQEMQEVMLNEQKKYSNEFLKLTENCLTYLQNTERYGEKMNWEVIEWCKLQDKTDDLQTLDFYPELEMYYNINRYDK